ncbi:hypothetical protein ACFSSC_01365 [Corynebacterium mendelii]|uniref:PAS domain-containing protein n=1 Tax=Corynebacterium mendelii TaxID=2765362 RepID=A0A939IXC7_9CORY|nr:PAS domain-containing protein [Corynebacterium mendelii]MBN9643928.1 PAS domain-containing protein [Corynebacterium mendelii]
MPTVEPTGATHEVGLEEMFFSTTDAKGVIRESNDVFVRLSRFPLDELVGAPHNCIRHPEMPGGAFYGMWVLLQSGKPFAAYVRNLAKDGSEYDVFATITPMPNGDYLSVRTRVSCPELFEAACGIYADVRAKERELMAAGANRHEAAVEGFNLVTEAIQGLGFQSYEEFQWAVLPEEILARQAETGPLPQPKHIEPGPMETIHEAVDAIAARLGDWMDALTAVDDLSNSLHKAGRTMRREMESAEEVTAHLTARANSDEGLPQETLMPLQVWTQMRKVAAPRLEKLFGQLEEFDQFTARTKFSIALCRLQTEMMARFVTELSDGGIKKRGAVALEALAIAFGYVMAEMDELADTYNKKAKDVAATIAGVADLMGIPQQVMVEWRRDHEKDGERLGGTMGELLQEVNRSIIRAEEALDSLRRCSAAAGDATAVDNTAAITERIKSIEINAGELIRKHDADNA